MPGKIIKFGTPRANIDLTKTHQSNEKWKGREYTYDTSREGTDSDPIDSPKEKKSSTAQKFYHSESKMRKGNVKVHKKILNLSLADKKLKAQNINILKERKSQLITKESLLEAKRYIVDSKGEKMQNMSLEDIISSKEMDIAQEEYLSIENELNKLHLEAAHIINLTSEILNSDSPNSYDAEIHKVSELVLKDSHVEEMFSTVFNEEISSINGEIKALGGENNYEINRLEDKLVELYQKKYVENEKKITILKTHPYENVTETTTRIKKNIKTMSSENIRIKEILNMLQNKKSLRSSFFNEFSKVQILEATLNEVNLTIATFEKEFPGSDVEISELISKQKKLEAKLENKLEKATKASEKFKNFLKNHDSEISGLEYRKINENFEMLENLSNTLFVNTTKQIQIAARKLEMKSNEKPLKEITDDFSKTISDLTVDWQLKTKKDQEDALKKINLKYDEYSAAWAEKKENVDAVIKFRNEMKIESSLLLTHDAIKGAIAKLNAQFKIDGTIDKNLIFILKKVCNSSAGYSRTLLRSVAKVGKLTGAFAVVAGIGLAIYLSELFKNDKKNFLDEVKNTDLYNELHHEVDDLKKYIDVVNEDVKGAITIDKDILALYDQAVKNHVKIKSRVDQLKNFFLTSSIAARVEIGDTLAHKIDEKYPNVLVEGNDKNSKLGHLELLRNPWASKKVIEEYPESGEVAFNKRIEMKAAKFGLKVDHLVDYTLPEYVNFRKAYSAHQGVSAEIRLIDKALEYDTSHMREIKENLLNSIKNFEETTKLNNDNRYFIFARSDTSEHTAMEKAKFVIKKNQELRTEKKKLKDARNQAINKVKKSSLKDKELKEAHLKSKNEMDEVIDLIPDQL